MATDATRAASFWQRLCGLLGTSSLPAGGGLYIAPCRQIHMFGMKYAIDVVFLDRDFCVVGLCKKIAPGHASAVFWRANGCLELPAGTIDDTGTELGDRIVITENT
ncbi:MAG: DUF192 domain-containing protein [Candidatus Obscuribacterales bacterium]|nr:DUF192 domain-containing protein [Candidatus Obscuribacterales bacterium]